MNKNITLFCSFCRKTIITVMKPLFLFLTCLYTLSITSCEVFHFHFNPSTVPNGNWGMVRDSMRIWFPSPNDNSWSLGLWWWYMFENDQPDAVLLFRMGSGCSHCHDYARRLQGNIRVERVKSSADSDPAYFDDTLTGRMRHPNSNTIRTPFKRNELMNPYNDYYDTVHNRIIVKVDVNFP